jgi:hypothetical protein
MNFLSLAQNPTSKLHTCLHEYTIKLSFFLRAGLIVDRAVDEDVAIVELPVDLPAPENIIFNFGIINLI